MTQTALPVPDTALRLALSVYDHWPGPAIRLAGHGSDSGSDSLTRTRSLRLGVVQLELEVDSPELPVPATPASDGHILHTHTSKVK